MKDARSLRWWGVVTLFVIVAISCVDRINISVLITDHDFLSHIGLTPDDRTRQGLLATAFMVGYGVSSFVLTPFCAALFGVRRSLFAGLLLWGVVTFVSPAMNSYGLLLASRILLGLINVLLGVPLVWAFVRMPKVETGMPKPQSLGAAVGQVGQIVCGAMHTRYLWLITILTEAFLSYLWGGSNRMIVMLCGIVLWVRERNAELRSS